LSTADLTVGTSAGSAVGAWFCSGGVAGGDFIGRLESLSAELVDVITKLSTQTSGNQTIPPTGPRDAIDATGQAGTDPRAFFSGVASLHA
jgi:hypothetical protein